jgi:hypothetical protein
VLIRDCLGDNRGWCLFSSECRPPTSERLRTLLMKSATPNVKGNRSANTVSSPFLCFFFFFFVLFSSVSFFFFVFFSSLFFFFFFFFSSSSSSDFLHHTDDDWDPTDDETIQGDISRLLVDQPFFRTAGIFSAFLSPQISFVLILLSSSSFFFPPDIKQLLCRHCCSDLANLIMEFCGFDYKTTFKEACISMFLEIIKLKFNSRAFSMTENSKRSKSAALIKLVLSYLKTLTPLSLSTFLRSSSGYLQSFTTSPFVQHVSRLDPLLLSPEYRSASLFPGQFLSIQPSQQGTFASLHEMTAIAGDKSSDDDWEPLAKFRRRPVFLFPTHKNFVYLDLIFPLQLDKIGGHLYGLVFPIGDSQRLDLKDLSEDNLNVFLSSFWSLHHLEMYLFQFDEVIRYHNQSKYQPDQKHNPVSLCLFGKSSQSHLFSRDDMTSIQTFLLLRPNVNGLGLNGFSPTYVLQTLQALSLPSALEELKIYDMHAHDAHYHEQSLSSLMKMIPSTFSSLHSLEFSFFEFPHVVMVVKILQNFDSLPLLETVHLVLPNFSTDPLSTDMETIRALGRVICGRKWKNLHLGFVPIPYSTNHSKMKPLVLLLSSIALSSTLRDVSVEYFNVKSSSNGALLPPSSSEQQELDKNIVEFLFNTRGLLHSLRLSYFPMGPLIFQSLPQLLRPTQNSLELSSLVLDNINLRFYNNESFLTSWSQLLISQFIEAYLTLDISLALLMVDFVPSQHLLITRESFKNTADKYWQHKTKPYTNHIILSVAGETYLS